MDELDDEEPGDDERDPRDLFDTADGRCRICGGVQSRDASWDHWACEEFDARVPARPSHDPRKEPADMTTRRYVWVTARPVVPFRIDDRRVKLGLGWGLLRWDDYAALPVADLLTADRRLPLWATTPYHLVGDGCLESEPHVHVIFQGPTELQRAIVPLEQLSPERRAEIERLPEFSG
jgi:hypothetical protein